LIFSNKALSLLNKEAPPQGWRVVPLGDAISKSDAWIEIDPVKTYKEVTVRLWGRGVTLRGEKQGSQIGSNRRIKVHPGQFILSRIDARNGAFGLIPDELDGAIVSNDFPLFQVREDKLVPEFLGWLSRTHAFVFACKMASEGTTNRVRLKENKFYEIKLPLPSLLEQRAIVAKIEQFASKIEERRKLQKEVEEENNAMLKSAFKGLLKGTDWYSMRKVAPIIRRPVDIKPEEFYPELGVRSFGKGTFHKKALSGYEVGTKRLYWIYPEDLVFHNVFSWEGAVAVAKEEDQNRVGSHRFITCVPKEGKATSDFLRFYFLTQEGLYKIGQASPGGAGRNRTLGLKKLEAIEVPVASYEKQLWFNNLQAKVNHLKALQAQTAAELDALLPSILDRAFKGGL